MFRLLSTSIVALTLLPVAAFAEEEQLVWLRLDALQAGQTARLRTADAEYRVQLVNRDTGEARVTQSSGSHSFDKPRKVFLVGAASPPQPGDGGFGLVLMGELHEGMCIEWGWGSLKPTDRRTSKPLTAIVIETPSAAAQR